MTQVSFFSKIQASLSSAWQVPTKTTVLKGCLGLIIALSAMFIARKGQQSLQGKVAWGSDEPDATFAQRCLFLFRKSLFGLSNQDNLYHTNNKLYWFEKSPMIKNGEYTKLANLLIANSTKSPSPDLTHFAIGRNFKNKSQYIAIGPSCALTARRIESIGKFPLFILNANYDVLVNLISLSEEKIDYLKTPSHHALPTVICLVNEKRCFHFLAWENFQSVSDTNLNDLIDLAAQIAFRVSPPHNETAFIHCNYGTQRTAAFIAMVEMIAHQDELKGKSGFDSQVEMISILDEISHTAVGRVPAPDQLKMLLNPVFLKKLLNTRDSSIT